MWQLLFIAFLLIQVFKPSKTPMATGTNSKTDYASEIRSIRDKEKQKQIALAKQKAWKQKGGSI
jgi:hypothetical protein